MLVIASNITSRNRKVAEALKHFLPECIGLTAEKMKWQSAQLLQEMAKRCIAAGADVLEINLQRRFDHPEVMRQAVEAIQKVADCQLCLSFNKADTLEAALRACQRPPIVNYISLEEARMREFLPLAARYKAEVILFLASSPSSSNPADILKSAAVLVGAANESGIPNDRIIIDLGVFHITSDMGQSHVPTLLELLPALTETFEPPVRTTCWINNISAGVPKRLRPVINNVFMSMLAGAGLSSAFVDSYSRETMRTVRLIKVMRNELIYADSEAEL